MLCLTLFKLHICKDMQTKIYRKELDNRSAYLWLCKFSTPFEQDVACFVDHGKIISDNIMASYEIYIL